MRRKLTVSLVLVVVFLLLNIIGINLIEKTFLINDNILQAAGHRGWHDMYDELGNKCVFCSIDSYSGCTKENMPDWPPPCAF